MSPWVSDELSRSVRCLRRFLPGNMALSEVVELHSQDAATETVNACGVTVLAAAACCHAAGFLFPDMDTSSLRVSLVAFVLVDGLVVLLPKPLALKDQNAILLLSIRPHFSQVSFRPQENGVDNIEVKAWHKTAEARFVFDPILPSIPVLA